VELPGVDAERFQCLAPSNGVDDDAIEAREEALPETVPPGGPPRDEVVGREDEGP
jgi:hypothetical protein